MILTPGAYIKHRRTAAGLSCRDVVERIGTHPHVAEHVRAEWLEMIEADVMPATFNTIVALRCVIPFDLSVLERLAAIKLGVQLLPPRLCRICACSEHDPCADRLGACCWVERDLCSVCSHPALAAVAA